MIAYDTNVLIYALEGGSEWAGAAQAAVRRGEDDGAVLSVLVWQELMTGALLKGGDSQRLIVDALRHLRATEFVPVSQTTCERALALTKKYGRRVYGYDAITLATALEHRASEFITNDQALLGLEIEGLSIRGL